MVDRRALGMGQMAAAMGVLAVCLVVVLFGMGLLSFNTTPDGEAPTADVTGGIQRAKADLDLPFVVPVGLPSNWPANSFQEVNPAISGGAGASLVRSGWLTGEGAFVSLVQSNQSPAELVAAEIGQGLGSRGTAQGGGSQWSVFPGMREEVAWVRTQGPLTLLITGSASESDFQVLAAAVAQGS